MRITPLVIPELVTGHRGSINPVTGKALDVRLPCLHPGPPRVQAWCVPIWLFME
jgi:hypothetical protein